MLPMPTEKGIAAFEQLLATGASQGVVIYGIKEKFSEKLFADNAAHR